MPEADDIWAENSPQVKLIQHRYERLGLHTWNNTRVSKLARDLGVTLWVLCAQAGAFETVYDSSHDIFRLKLDKRLIKKAWKANHWPVIMTVNFERLEAYVKAKQGEGKGLIFGKADRVSAEILSGKLERHG